VDEAEVGDPRLVIDASVCLKWFLRDETLDKQAGQVLRDYIEGRLTLVAPSLLVLEFVNGLWVAARRRRIVFERVEEAVNEILDIRFEFRDVTDLSPKIVNFCRLFGRTAYDASYLALAEHEGIQLLTGDRRLYNAVHRRLDWVVWLGSYPP